jgi:hypothetical protein
LAGTSRPCRRSPWWRGCRKWMALDWPQTRSLAGRSKAPCTRWRRPQTCRQETMKNSLMRPRSRDRTRRLRAFVNPNFFSRPAPEAHFVVDAGLTQRGACRRAAGPERDARADAPKVVQTVGNDRLPAAPLSSETFRGPEFLRPRLAAGLPLSAFGRKAAVHSSRLDRRHQGVLRCISVPESSQACLA